MAKRTKLTETEQREADLDAAKRTLRADYYRSVRSAAEGVKAEITSGRLATSEALEQAIWEASDGCYWAIYTHGALECMLASDNWLAVEAEGIEAATDGNLAATVCAYAAYAYRRDLEQALEDLGIDLNDPTGKEESE